MADRVLYAGVGCITDLIVKEGLINLDFADVKSVMRGMGRAMMGTGEATGDGRAKIAAEAAIANPLLDEASMIGAKGVLVSISGGMDMTLFEVDEAATRIREEVDADANIIVGAIFDEALQGKFRVSVVATGLQESDGLLQFAQMNV
jgi:cell division protein FtsZ